MNPMDEIECVPEEEAPQWSVLSSWAPRTGDPGAIGEETPGSMTLGRLFVARDSEGAPAGILYVEQENGQASGLIVIVREDLRRRGIATALYDTAAGAGIEVEALSGATGLTIDGQLFRNARLAHQALA
jgi:hypothetical protein